MTPSRTPISQWLKSARLSQTNPDTGRPWSQEYLAERVSQETGWKLYREAYVGYERGAGMQPETLARFVDFWTRYGVEGPDLTEKDPPLSLEERAVVAAERQAEAAVAQTTLMARQVALLEQIATSLTGQLPAAQAAEDADTRAWALMAAAGLRPLAPVPADPLR